jgi:Sulfotransferase domain
MDVGTLVGRSVLHINPLLSSVHAVFYTCGTYILRYVIPCFCLCLYSPLFLYAPTALTMAVPLPPSQQRNITFMQTRLGRFQNLPPPYVRKIDLVDGRREKPMKILCLGYSRTGTMSLYTALRMLGYHPYHMAEAIRNADVDLECWNEGVEAKLLGKGKKWGREEFDKLTGKCDVR